MWVGVLVAAEAWGVPPWEIAGGDQMTWFWRFNLWRSYINKRDNSEVMTGDE